MAASSRDMQAAKVACAIARTALAAGVPIADALAIVAAAIAPLLYEAGKAGLDVGQLAEACKQTIDASTDKVVRKLAEMAAAARKANAGAVLS